jgi:hypothetical protein
LESAEGKVPTPRGPVLVKWRKSGGFRFELVLPAGMSARVELPAVEGSQGVFVGDRPLAAKRVGTRWCLDQDVSGAVVLEAR